MRRVSGRAAAALIPVRRGSKRIRGKNTKSLAGRPLLAYVVDAALRSGCFSGDDSGGGDREVSGAQRDNDEDHGGGDRPRIYLVSDDDEALRLGETLGARPVLLPAEMAGDTSPVIPVLQFAAAAVANNAEADGGACSPVNRFCYLRATSPFVRASSIRAAMARLEAAPREVDSVVGVREVTGSHPSRFKRIDPDTGLLVDAFPAFPEGKVPSSSSSLRALQRNSAVTAMWADTLASGSLWGDRTLPLVMGEEESVDINTPLEWDFAEFLMARCSSGHS